MSLALLVVIWPTVAPQSLGGTALYVKVSGKSMEPTFHTGDLVVLRRSSTYSVGEVVGFRSEVVDGVIIHRVIGNDGEAFMTKGDNNSFVDGERPQASDVYGHQVAHFPGLARWAEWATNPLPVGALALLVGWWAFVAPDSRRRRDRRGRPLPLVVPQ